MSLLIEIAQHRVQSSTHSRFHLRMACAGLILMVICFAGCRLTSIHIEVGKYVGTVFVLLAMLAPLPVYWHEKGRITLRESTLVIPWEMLVAVLVPATVLIAGRSRMPLQDSLFAHMDQALGVNVPSVMGWASSHWLGRIIDRSYGLLLPLLVIAALVPGLTGKMKYAREFLLANLVAFAIGISAFALLPAVGPWYYYHTLPNSLQAVCQSGLLSLRLPGPFVPLSQGAGFICFPSFHVIWAILCAAALWGFRSLRIPIALLSGTIVVSTMTTGWHYFSDVLAGVVVAVLAIAIAKVYAV